MAAKATCFDSVMESYRFTINRMDEMTKSLETEIMELKHARQDMESDKQYNPQVDKLVETGKPTNAAVGHYNEAKEVKKEPVHYPSPQEFSISQEIAILQNEKHRIIDSRATSFLSSTKDRLNQDIETINEQIVSEQKKLENLIAGHPIDFGVPDDKLSRRMYSINTEIKDLIIERIASRDSMGISDIGYRTMDRLRIKIRDINAEIRNLKDEKQKMLSRETETISKDSTLAPKDTAKELYNGSDSSADSSKKWWGYQPGEIPAGTPGWH
jgi:hypothetical protein